MQDHSPIRNIEFWIAVGAALLIKVKTTRQFGWIAVTVSSVASVMAAWVASGWVAAVTGLPYAIAAALVTLTADGAMRWVIIALNDPRQAIDLWKYWRKP